jgi:hypothetical protein
MGMDIDAQNRIWFVSITFTLHRAPIQSYVNALLGWLVVPQPMTQRVGVVMVIN